MEAKIFNFVFNLVLAKEFSLSCFSKLFNETRSDTGQKTKKEKVKHTLHGSCEYQEAEAPRFKDNQHMKGCQPYALDAFTTQEIFLVFIYVRG